MGSPTTNTREQTLALAAAGRSWEVLGPADRLLHASPGDHELRAAVVAHAAGVGLRTLAQEQFAHLPRAVRESPGISTLKRTIESLPNDAVPAHVLEATLRANLDALACRGVDLHSLFLDWNRRLASIAVFRASNGNIVWRKKSIDDTLAPWLCLEDRRTPVEQARLPFLDEAGRLDPSNPPKPVVVEGLDPPWLALRVHGLLARMADGYEPHIVLVQRDPMELLDGLCLTDLRDVLADQRVDVFAGHDAAERVEARFLDRLHLTLPAHLLRAVGLRTPVDPPLERVFQSLHERQQRTHERLAARSTVAYEGRDRAWWANRYAQAASGDGPPLRVLLPISRYSTFVRHSAEDLAAALGAHGCEARVLSEPDSHSKLASVAYLREFAEWQPDLVVLINYARCHLGSAVPAAVPFVCWIQDRMPHLARPEVGAAQGPLDFLAGYLQPDLFSLFGFPAERSAYWPVPASSRKFHGGPVDPHLEREHVCEIAYVSHQSEPPERALERLLAPFRTQPQVERAFWLVYDTLLRSLDADGPATLRAELDLPAIYEQAGIRNPDPRMTSAFVGFGLIPLAERIYRHATLRWAARIAQRRGWRLHLYGRGWERHPTLAQFARGELAHDEALRTVYRTARAHLHASVTTNAHQRVAECALSGGLMLRRGPSPDYEPVRQHLHRLVFERFEPTERRENGDWVYEIPLPTGAAVTDWQSPDPVRFRRMKHAAPPAPGPDGTATIAWRVPREWREVAFARLPRIDPGQFPDYAFPDAPDTLFRTPEELESMLARAIDDPAWRERTIAGHRRIALERMTSDTIAERLLSLVRSGLAG